MEEIMMDLRLQLNILKYNQNIWYTNILYNFYSIIIKNK